MLFVAASLVLCGFNAADAKGKSGSKMRAATPKSDVVVTKNSDGTVEVNDAGAQGSGDGGTVYNTHTIYYKPAPAATLHYGDGVVVHRNADGSCEVSDEDAPVYHSFSSAPARSHRTAVRHAVARTHSAAKAATAQKGK